MVARTPRGAPYAEAADPNDLTSHTQGLANWVDGRPGITPMSTAGRDVLTGTDLWDWRVIANTTTGRLERYDATAKAWRIAAITDLSNVDAQTLDGIDSTGFLRTTGKAADADRLDGRDSTEFALLTGAAFTGAVSVGGALTKQLPNGKAAADAPSTYPAGFSTAAVTVGNGWPAEGVLLSLVLENATYVSQVLISRSSRLGTIVRGAASATTWQSWNAQGYDPALTAATLPADYPNGIQTTTWAAGAAGNPNTTNTFQSFTVKTTTTSILQIAIARDSTGLQALSWRQTGNNAWGPWQSVLSSEGKAADSDKLDGIDSTGFIRTGVTARQAVAGEFSAAGQLVSEGDGTGTEGGQLQLSGGNGARFLDRITDRVRFHDGVNELLNIHDNGDISLRRFFLAPFMRHYVSHIGADESTTSSTAWVFLPTFGPVVDLDAPPSGRLTVAFGAHGTQGGSGEALMGYQVLRRDTGFNTHIGPRFDQTVSFSGNSTFESGYMTGDVEGLVSGAPYRVEAVYRSTTGATARFKFRRMIVIPSP